MLELAGDAHDCQLPGRDDPGLQRQQDRRPRVFPSGRLRGVRAHERACDLRSRSVVFTICSLDHRRCRLSSMHPVCVCFQHYRDHLILKHGSCLPLRWRHIRSDPVRPKGVGSSFPRAMVVLVPDSAGVACQLREDVAAQHATSSVLWTDDARDFLPTRHAVSSRKDAATASVNSCGSKCARLSSG